MSFITTIAELKKYVAIDANSKMATFNPFIKDAEKVSIAPLLGPDFYIEFLATYAASIGESPTPLTDPEKEFLELLQRSLSNYTLVKAIPHLAVSFGEMGTRQARSDSSDPAPRWKEEKLQQEAYKNADVYADELLKFLEENAAADNDFQTWFASPANTKNSGFIVYSTAVASRHIDINNSRRVFLQLRNAIREIETRLIPKLISQDQYDELVIQLKTGGAGNPTDANKALIEKIEPIVSKHALYMRLPFMRVQLTETGLFIYSSTDDLVKLGQLATKDDVEDVRCELKDGKFGFMQDEEELRQFILKNIDDYPLIKASGIYTVQPDPGPTWTSKNDPNSKHVSV